MYSGETVKFSEGFCGLFPNLWSSLPAASSCEDPEAAQFSPCASCIAEMTSLISIKCSIPTAVGKSVPFGLISTKDISSPDSPVCVQHGHSSHALSSRVLQKLSDSASGAASPSRFGDPFVREKRGRTADALGNAQAARSAEPSANGRKQSTSTRSRP
ncbi:uncharacterized protein LOC119594053 isoform X1 [Penaeus monodon]|uniref:uncharacterized protein LOC119594053 isoform X1 n=1 Tax=Penaeus monodon TaxID=6687 RepID=UPI0018A74A34|nr:uncharacterized protein LOC119594053 isoform X1 [Penaeus monodon]